MASPIEEELETLIQFAEQNVLTERQTSRRLCITIEIDKRNSMTTEIQQCKKLYDIKNNNDYQILWSRGKEVLNFPIGQKLARTCFKTGKRCFRSIVLL